MIEVFSYNRNKLNNSASINLSEIKSFISSKQKLWINIEKPTDSDFEKINLFCNFHPTIKERIISGVSRTKYEEFDDFTYVAMKCIDVKSNDEVGFHYIYFLDGDNFLITISTEYNDSISNLKKNSKKIESLLSKGEDYILHYILDKEVDKYVVVRESIADDLHKIEEDFLNLHDSDLLRLLFGKERLVLEVSHATDSITNMCLMLKKPTDNFISNSLLPYFADIYDHAYKSNQGLNNYLKQIEAMRNTNLALNSNKLNKSIQILTIVMALMMPMTIVTGFFGMNVPLPYQTNIHAYQILIFIMFLTVIVLLIIFKKFGWIGKRKL